MSIISQFELLILKQQESALKDLKREMRQSQKLLHRRCGEILQKGAEITNRGKDLIRFKVKIHKGIVHAFCVNQFNVKDTIRFPEAWLSMEDYKWEVLLYDLHRDRCPKKKRAPRL